MKNKASAFLKHVVSLLSSIAKAKSLAVKNKTSALKARAVMYSLSKNRKILMGSISNKIHGILGQVEKESENGDEDQSKAIVLYCNGKANDDMSNNDYSYYDDDDDDNKYPDLTHSLFDEEEFDDPGGSVIDLVKNSKEEGENFSLEDEIDHVADLFITRFHKQMRLQKLESFKRYQEMLARSV